MRKGWGHGEDGQDREVHGRGSLFRRGWRVPLRGCRCLRPSLRILRWHGGRVLLGNHLYRHRDRLALYSRYASRPPRPSGVRPPPRRARAPQGRTGEPGMVTPWGTREGALRHVAHIDRY